MLMYFLNRLLKQYCCQNTSLTEGNIGSNSMDSCECLNTLGNSLSGSLSPSVTLDHIVVDILLLSHPVDQE